jgi:pSer/pThr/pTyr-binding forkhead associated (FHA) protein
MSSLRLVLEVTDGPLKGKLIVVKSGETIRVGRTPKAEIALAADTFLSGVHFALECDSNGGRLRDLKSRNGTKLNGEYIQEAVLQNGDMVYAGQTEFVVRFEASDSLSEGEVLSRSLRGSKRRGKKPRPTQTSLIDPTYEMPASAHAPVEPPPPPTPPKTSASEQPALPPQTPPPVSQSNSAQEAALSAFEAATPEGRLFQLLSSQPQPLMALIDGVRDRSVLEFLKTSGVEHCSLYNSNANAAIAPYLVSLPPRSEALKGMIKKGWGHEWGVYLTCPFSLSELRNHFRTSLMVTMPDGMELFSRFYDPRFFREFLEGCSSSEAEKFFGPVSSYFMEDERPEILLQYTNGKTGTEKKGHLLTDLV